MRRYILSTLRYRYIALGLALLTFGFVLAGCGTSTSTSNNSSAGANTTIENDEEATEAEDSDEAGDSEEEALDFLKSRLNSRASFLILFVINKKHRIPQKCGFRTVTTPRQHPEPAFWRIALAAPRDLPRFNCFPTHVIDANQVIGVAGHGE